jgi:hypothetical protein
MIINILPSDGAADYYGMAILTATEAQLYLDRLLEAYRMAQ